MLKFFASLRSRAIFLVLLAILPLLALTLNSYLEERDKAILEVQRDAVVAVRNLATIQETLISSTRQLLLTYPARRKCSAAITPPATACSPVCWSNAPTTRS